MIEANRIIPGLYQGSKPSPGDSVRLAGFHVLVLCAQEYQPGNESFPGVRVIHCPLHDDMVSPPSSDELRSAYQAGHDVARHLRRGKRVLVTCRMGLNRSGLVTAIALHALHGVPGEHAVKHVQGTRPGALFNKTFVKALEGLRERPSRPK